jgi:hyperosmotically inducible periplasmic protein
MRRNSLMVLGAAGLAFAATAANAQLDPVQSATDAARAPVPTRSDASIGLEVQAQLMQNMSVTGVTSQTQNGVTRLRGTVRSLAEKDQAEQIARRVHGVSSVDNGITVDPRAVAAAETSHSAGGDTLAATVRGNLYGQTQLAGQRIDVQTRGNIVTLTGEVSSEAEKELAGRIAGDTREVSEVRNRLVVRGE